jgi:hypothetical protein
LSDDQDNSLGKIIRRIKNLDARHRDNGQIMKILNYLGKSTSLRNMNSRHKLSDDQDNELAGQIHQGNDEFGQQAEGKLSDDPDTEVTGQIHQDNEELGQQAQAKWSNDEDAELPGQIYQLSNELGQQI